MTIPDPGFGLPRDAARAARLAAWSRPVTAEERTAGREERRNGWLSAIAEGRRAAAAGQFLVTTKGQPAGNGSTERPWDLATALASETVGPGDTVWVAAGTYRGVFRCELLGEPQNEIVVRALPGERVTIDGGIRIESGGHIGFRDFEVTNSGLKRRTELPGSEPADIDANDGFYVTAPYVKLINNVIHDTPQGIAIWGTAVGCEVYGNIVYNNGWTGPDRAHGHGIYTQNNDSTRPKRIEHNVFANNYSYNVHCYGGGGASLQGSSFDENVAVNRRWLIGGETPAAGMSLRGNHLFRESLELGYSSSDNQDIAVSANILVDGPLALRRWDSFDVQNNTVAATMGESLSVEFEASSAVSTTGSRWDGTNYVSLGPAGSQQFSANGRLLSGFSAWVATTAFDRNGQILEAPPDGPWVYLHSNKYDADRALLVIYNWSLENDVGVEVAQLFASGTSFAISNCLNPAESIEATYREGAVRLPMMGWTTATPMNDESEKPPSTWPFFGVFLLKAERESRDEDASDPIPRPRDRD